VCALQAALKEQAVRQARQAEREAEREAQAAELRRQDEDARKRARRSQEELDERLKRQADEQRLQAAAAAEAAAEAARKAEAAAQASHAEFKRPYITLDVASGNDLYMYLAGEEHRPALGSEITLSELPALRWTVQSVEFGTAVTLECASCMREAGQSVGGAGAAGHALGELWASVKGGDWSYDTEQRYGEKQQQAEKPSPTEQAAQQQAEEQEQEQADSQRKAEGIKAAKRIQAHEEKERQAHENRQAKEQAQQQRQKLEQQQQQEEDRRRQQVAEADRQQREEERRVQEAQQAERERIEEEVRQLERQQREQQEQAEQAQEELKLRQQQAEAQRLAQDAAACADDYPSCAVWSEKGACSGSGTEFNSDFRAFMLAHCKGSCVPMCPKSNGKKGAASAGYMKHSREIGDLVAAADVAAEKASTPGCVGACSRDALKQADTLASRLVRLEPTNADHLLRRFTVQLRERKYPEALETLNKAVACPRRDASAARERALHQRANLNVLLGLCDQAVKDHTELLAETRRPQPAGQPKRHAHKAPDYQADRNSAQSCKNHLQGARRSIREGNHRQAVMQLNHAIGHAKAAPELLLLRMRANGASGNNDFAAVLKDGADLLRLEPSSIEAHRLRADAYVRQGTTERALAHLRQALHFDPEHQSSKRLYRMLKVVMKALKQANAAPPHLPFSHEDSKWSLLAKAKDKLREEMGNTPYGETILLLQAQTALQHSGKTTECRAAANEAIKMQERGSGRGDQSVLAQLHALVGDANKKDELWQEAMESYRNAMNIDRGNQRYRGLYNDAQRALQVNTGRKQTVNRPERRSVYGRAARALAVRLSRSHAFCICHDNPRCLTPLPHVVALASV
jgi:hypothetical protein